MKGGKNLKRIIKFLEDFKEVLNALINVLEPLEVLTIKIISWLGWVFLLIYILNQK